MPLLRHLYAIGTHGHGVEAAIELELPLDRLFEASCHAPSSPEGCQHVRGAAARAGPRGKLDTPMAVRYGWRCGLRETPDIEHARRRMRVGASLGECNAAIGDDRAVPM